MKKIIITVFAFCCFINAQAQFEKGTKWIAGSFSLNFGGNKVSQTNYQDYNYSSLGIGTNIRLSKFATEKKMNSFFLGYYYGKSNNKNDSLNSFGGYNHNFSIGYGITNLYQLLPKIYSTVTTNFYGQYSFANSNNDYVSTYSNTSSIQKRNSFSANIGINLGLMYRVNDRFAVTTTVNNVLYASIATNSDEYKNIDRIANTEINRNTKGYNFNGGFGLSGFNFGNLQFGLMYRLKK